MSDILTETGNQGEQSQEREFIRRFVARVRGRLRRQRLLRRALQGAAAGLIVAAPVLLFGRWGGMSVGASKVAPFLCAVFGLLLFVLLAPRGDVSGAGAAKIADRRLGMRDQLVNAFQFVEERRIDPLADLTVEFVANGLKGGRALAGAAPLRFPGVAWLLIAAVALCWGTQRGLFAGQERRRIEVSQDLNASLLDYVADVADGDEKGYKASLALMEELQMLSAKADKEEILARLSRMIDDADASDDEAMKKQLAGLKKLKDDFAMGELRRELQEELDKGHEELAVTDDKGKTVKAEAIKTLALAEKRRKGAELAAKVKQVAERIGKEKPKETKPSGWAVKESRETKAGAKKTVKREAASYKDLEQIARNRDIRKMILDAAADRERGSGEYKEVYDNYSRIMKTYLFEKGLPGGQTEYIRRYFRVIEPRGKK